MSSFFVMHLFPLVSSKRPEVIPVVKTLDDEEEGLGSTYVGVRYQARALSFDKNVSGETPGGGVCQRWSRGGHETPGDTSQESSYVHHAATSPLLRGRNTIDGHSSGHVGTRLINKTACDLGMEVRVKKTWAHGHEV